jgi:hypothetical protein
MQRALEVLTLAARRDASGPLSISVMAWVVAGNEVTATVPAVTVRCVDGLGAHQVHGERSCRHA